MAGSRQYFAKGAKWGKEVRHEVASGEAVLAAEWVRYAFSVVVACLQEHTWLLESTFVAIDVKGTDYSRIHHEILD